MRFSPSRFNNHIRSMGQNFSWRRAYACPCVNGDSGAAKPDCPHCDGKGRVWGDGVSVRVGMTAQKVSTIQKDFGSYQAGDSILTIGSDASCYGCGLYDRFRAHDSSSPFSINLRRGFKDKIRFSVQSFDRVFWLNDQREEVEGELPVLDADTGALTWPDGGAPPEGKWFSISGVRWDEFYAYQDLSQDRNAGISKLPRKLLVRRFDLFGR